MWKASGARGVTIPASEAFANKTILLDEALCMCVSYLCVSKSEGCHPQPASRETPINRDPPLSLSLYLFLLSSRGSIPEESINFLDESAFRGTGSLLLNAYQSAGSREGGKRGRRGWRFDALLNAPDLIYRPLPPISSDFQAATLDIEVVPLIPRIMKSKHFGSGESEGARVLVKLRARSPNNFEVFSSGNGTLFFIS